MEILLKVAQFSSLLVFPITAVSMAIVQAIVQHYHKDTAVTALILLFWDTIQFCPEIHVNFIIVVNAMHSHSLRFEVGSSQEQRLLPLNITT